MLPISSIASALPRINGAMPGLDAMPGLKDLPAEIKMPKDLGQLPGVSRTHASGDSFESMLGHMVAEVNGKQNVAANAVAALQSGQPVPLHQTVIAMEEAGVAFQLMVEVRNKLLESYQELMRMQI